MLEQRLSKAITATAGMIIGAWEQAGRPSQAGRRASGSEGQEARRDWFDEAVYLVPHRIRALRALHRTARRSRARCRSGRHAVSGARRIHQLHQRWQQTVQAAQRRRTAGTPVASPALATGSSAGSPSRSPNSARSGRCAAVTVGVARVSAEPVRRSRGPHPRSSCSSRARRHHGWWLLVDRRGGHGDRASWCCCRGRTCIGYYFAFRVVGHYLSWRGARQALDRISWRPAPEPALAELGCACRAARATQRAEPRRGDCRALEPAAARGIFRSRRSPASLRNSRVIYSALTP